MSTMKLFSVHDAKAAFYSQPFYARTSAEARRSFSDTVNADSDPNNLMAKHHADYTLFELGEFDPMTGKITVFDAPVPHGNGVDFKIQQ